VHQGLSVRARGCVLSRGRAVDNYLHKILHFSRKKYILQALARRELIIRLILPLSISIGMDSDLKVQVDV